ncbi:hypothetical protein L3073_04910 [Ancylomarina sp. DW003]|nr:hypothetical protein [Ancylomarina sp. DW003]MDE5421537.1 hypothetical protein [Ancylomarina sp. DW003]
MRKIGFALIILLAGLASCTVQEIDDESLFAELGLEQLIINDEVIDVNELGMPYAMSENVTLDGFFSGVTRMDYNLLVLCGDGEDAFIEVVSRYDDIDVEIDSFVENDIIFYKIYISRWGQDELITYEIAFLDTCYS